MTITYRVVFAPDTLVIGAAEVAADADGRLRLPAERFDGFGGLALIDVPDLASSRYLEYLLETDGRVVSYEKQPAEAKQPI